MCSRANKDHGWHGDYGWITFGIAGGRWMWAVQSDTTGEEVATGTAATKAEAYDAAEAWAKAN